MSEQIRGVEPRRRLALTLLGTAFFMVILEGTIVYVALPQIGDDLGFSAAGLEWVAATADHGHDSVRRMTFQLRDREEERNAR